MFYFFLRLAVADGILRESGRIELKRKLENMNQTALWVLAAVASAASAQDVTLRMQADAAGASTYYISRNAVRYTNAVVNVDVIYRLDQNVVITLDGKSKTYRRVSLSAPPSATARPAAGNSAELFRQLGFDAAPTVTSLGPGGNIAGYATQKYLVATSGVRAEIWIAPSLEMPEAYYDANTRFKKSTMFDMTKFDQEIRKIKGTVLKRSVTVTLAGTGQKYTETTTVVDRNPIPPATFDIPAYYQAQN